AGLADTELGLKNNCLCFCSTVLQTFEKQPNGSLPKLIFRQFDRGQARSKIPQPRIVVETDEGKVVGTYHTHLFSCPHKPHSHQVVGHKYCVRTSRQYCQTCAMSGLKPVIASHHQLWLALQAVFSHRTTITFVSSASIAHLSGPANQCNPAMTDSRQVRH